MQRIISSSQTCHVAEWMNQREKASQSNQPLYCRPIHEWYQFSLEKLFTRVMDPMGNIVKTVLSILSLYAHNIFLIIIS